MLKKVVLVQRYLPHYRLHTLNSVALRLGQENFSFSFLYGLDMGRFSRPVWARKLFSISMPLHLGEMLERAVFMPTLIFYLLKISPHMMILEDLSGFPNNFLACLYCLVLRRPYLIWGLGKIPDKRPSILRTFLSPLIFIFYRFSSGFICYSQHAQAVYAKTGKPTFLAPNACLPPHTSSEQAMLQDHLKRRRDVLKIVSMGSLTRQKRTDILLEALAQLQDPNIQLHLIGDGPLHAELEKKAENLGVGGQVVFHGAVFDPLKKRELLLQCDLGILPGRGGLAIQELMWHGLPVISGTADGTERDLIKDAQNGFLAPDLVTTDYLVERIRWYRSQLDSKKVEMSRSAAQTINTTSNTELMAEGIVRAVQQTIWN